MTLPEPDLEWDLCGTHVGPVWDLCGNSVGPVWDWRPERTWNFQEMRKMDKNKLKSINVAQKHGCVTDDCLMTD